MEMGLDGTGLEEAMAQGTDNNQGLPNGAATAAPPDGVRAFDQNGREVIVPREEWRTNVIPGMLQEAWDKPDQLYMVILNSLNDGFVTEVADAAAHLHAIDPIPGRGACMLAIVQMQTGRAAEAEELLTSFSATHPEDGSVLVNLAKLYADTGRKELAEATLKHAVEVEPNHDTGLSWYASLIHERDGEPAAQALLQQVAAHPKSWRAQLWLARPELNAGNVASARAMYEEALTRAPKPVPPDFMMQMSGDLGAKGFLRELIELTIPHFSPEWHGMPVGNNLIKALVDTGNLDPAEQVKAALWAQNRPDWKDALLFWDAEIARRRVAAVDAASGVPQQQQPQQQQLQVGMLRVDGPVWLPPGSPARRLFSVKSPSAPKVTFLGGTAEAPEAADPQSQVQIADALGRMTRSLPLFFAEQVEMRTAAAGRAMVPWAVAPMSGFVVSGQRWPDETAVQAVQVPENASEYVVSVHIDAEIEPWTAELTFVRTVDGTRIGELQAEFLPATPEEGLADLADEVVELLSVLGPSSLSPAYEVPGPTTFASYLLRLEQLLAVRCASMEGVPPQFLSGEQQILQDELELCRAEPTNIPARLLLQSTLTAFEKLKPETVNTFADDVARLRAEFPVPAVDGIAV
jgi:tetratricopeptide (TPR) repeat protein